MRASITTKRGPKKGTKLLDIKRGAVGERIFSVRRSRGISQRQLGEKTGLSLRAISYYERESERLPAPVLAKIAKALNVTISYLLGESPLKKPVDETPFSVQRMLHDFRNLPKVDQKTVLNTIQGLVAKNRLRQQKKVAASAGTSRRPTPAPH